MAIDADGASAFPFGDLSYGASDASSGSGTEGGLSGLEICGLDEADPGSHEIHAHGRGFLEAQVLWLLTHAGGGHDDEFRVRAVALESEIAAASPDLASYHLGRPCAHDSGKVASWSARQDGPVHSAE